MTSVVGRLGSVLSHLKPDNVTNDIYAKHPDDGLPSHLLNFRTYSQCDLNSRHRHGGPIAAVQIIQRLVQGHERRRAHDFHVQGDHREDGDPQCQA